MGLKLNGTYQLLLNAHDVNMFGDDMYSIKKNEENVIDAS
jgi:hypothetical protein